MTAQLRGLIKDTAVDLGPDGFDLDYGFGLVDALAGLEMPTFTDVPSAHGFSTFIEALADSGITGGCATNPARYCPDTPVT